jgi:hypothetical protein
LSYVDEIDKKMIGLDFYITSGDSTPEVPSSDFSIATIKYNNAGVRRGTNSQDCR